MIPYYTIPFMTEQALHDDPIYKLLQGADEEKKEGNAATMGRMGS
jgi:hypothetical protein